MKKSMIFVGMLAIGFANAQLGNMGINEESPKATLDIKPNANNAKADATTNIGLLIPRLSKARVAKMTNPETSTLVYVNNKTYTAGTDTNADTRVAEINEVGFYYYNGTKWVKQTGQNGELWAQRDNNGVTETYLKPAANNGDQIYYTPKSFHTNLGGVTTGDATIGNWIDFKEQNIPITSAITSKILPNDSGMSRLVPFINNYAIINNNHPSLGATANTKDYVLNRNVIRVAPTSVGTINAIYGSESKVSINTAQKINYAYAQLSNLEIEEQANTGSNIGHHISITAQKNSNNETVTGLYITPRNLGGKIGNLMGINATIDSSVLSNGSSNYPTTSYNSFSGSNVRVNIQPNTTVKRITSHNVNSKFQNKSVVDVAFGIDVGAEFSSGMTMKDYFGIDSYLTVPNTDTGVIDSINNVYAIAYTQTLPATFKPKNMYGLHLANVDRGTNSNYAIYTNVGKVRFGDNVGVGIDNPKERLEINGAIKVANTTSTCTTANVGTIKFENDNFYGCKSTGWVKLNP